MKFFLFKKGCLGFSEMGGKRAFLGSVCPLQEPLNFFFLEICAPSGEKRSLFLARAQPHDAAKAKMALNIIK